MDERKRDRELGMDREISRRDFLNGVAVGAGTTLLAGPISAGQLLAAGVLDEPSAEKAPDYYPPAKLGMRGNGGLHHDARMLGSDTRGEKQRGGFLDLGAQLVRRLVNRHGVQIDDAENALVIVLDLDPVAERSEIIADVQIAGGLDAGEYACFHGVGIFYRKRCSSRKPTSK